jgi:hypothetical protein
MSRHDLEVVELPIPAGEAARTVVAAFSNLVAAVVAMEKVSMTLARALDAAELAKRGQP